MKNFSIILEDNQDPPPTHTHIVVVRCVYSTRDLTNARWVLYQRPISLATSIPLSVVKNSWEHLEECELYRKEVPPSSRSIPAFMKLIISALPCLLCSSTETELELWPVPFSEGKPSEDGVWEVRYLILTPGKENQLSNFCFGVTYLARGL